MFRYSFSTKNVNDKRSKRGYYDSYQTKHFLTNLLILHSVDHGVPCAHHAKTDSTQHVKLLKTKLKISPN